MSKKVYVVRGSEDGTLGVFTTMKKAWVCATNYVTDSDRFEPPRICNGVLHDGSKPMKYVTANYRNTCKIFQEDWWVDLQTGCELSDENYFADGRTVSIDLYYLNQE